MVDLTAILEAVVALAAAVITTFFIPWIRGKVSAQQWNTLVSVTELAVKAAEQIYGGGLGAEKRAFVLEYLAQKGYSADLVVLEGLVNEIFGRYDTDEPAECACSDCVGITAEEAMEADNVL